MTPLTYNIDEAAERLGSMFTVDWLRKHLDEIPHVRTGAGTGRAGRIGFTESHLAEILLMHEVRPDSKPAPSRPDEFTPLTRRRTA